MYNTQFRRGEEKQGGAQLLGKLASQIERDAAKVGVAQQIVQIVRQQLKHQAQVVAPHKVAL